MGIRESALLLDITENRVIHTARPWLHHCKVNAGGTRDSWTSWALRTVGRGKCVITDRGVLSCSVASQVRISPEQAAVFMLSSPLTFLHLTLTCAQLPLLPVIPYC